MVHRWTGVLLVIVAFAGAAVSLHQHITRIAATGNSIATPEPFGVYGGDFTSLKMDSSANPVIAQYDASNGDLKVLHCGDPFCTTGNSDISVDTLGDVGAYTSLALDTSGYPVVSYQDRTNYDLKVLHCGDAACSSGNTIAAPDTGEFAGFYTSIAIDAAGNPVVSYNGDSAGNLKVLHCGNPACTAGNSIVTADAAGYVGQWTSLALDSSGYPVVSYYDYGNGDLRVLHCGDPACTAGNTIATPDSAGNVGGYTSLALDAAGNPVVSYYDVDNIDLKVLHCGNPTCTTGNTIATPDAGGNVGAYTSLRLNSSGFPVVAYYDDTNTTLKVLVCGNANCTSGNSISAPDPLGDGVNSVGTHASLDLDPIDNPVVSYQYANGEQLRVLHCSDVLCHGEKSFGFIPGDANCDGVTNAIDAALILQFTAGLVGSLPCQHRADWNGSGAVDAIDAALVLQYTAGLIGFPP